jgi:hypothetical protein
MSDVVFPISPLELIGAQIDLRRTPATATEIQTASSGKELRATWQSYPRYKYQLHIEFLRSAAVYADFQRVMTAFVSALGQYDTFLLQDPEDNSVTQHGFAIADGSSTLFQLQRTLGGVRRSGKWDPASYIVSSTPRTNLCLQSQAFNTAPWAADSATITTAAALAPDGSFTACKIAETATTAFHGAHQTFTTVAGQRYTISVYLKAGERQWAMMTESNGVTASAWFDLVNGAVGTVSGTGSPTATITKIAAGWYRCTLSFTAGGVNANIQARPASANGVSSYAGTAGSGVYAWGGQAEQANAATAYVATTAAAVTVNPLYWPQYGDGFEPVTEVNPATLAVFDNGTQLAQDGSAYTLVSGGGILFASAPAGGHVLTWSGDYFRRVRFAADEFDFDRLFSQMWDGKQIDFISVK